MNIRAIPTKFNGIEFRSKLEAHWFASFQDAGFKPLYEPESLSIEMWYGTDDGDGPAFQQYIPDLLIQSCEYFVEIKPRKSDYIGHDVRSIASACVLGYHRPTILIFGSPFDYVAVEVKERRKGNPFGYRIAFNEHACNRWECLDMWSPCVFYPDEEKYDAISYEDLDLNDFSSAGSATQNAHECWNRIKWNR